jgi:hypothetical protein
MQWIYDTKAIDEIEYLLYFQVFQDFKSSKDLIEVYIYM